MEVIARHGEREERLRLRRDGDAWEVTVGDRTYRVESAVPGPGVHSLIVEGAHFEVTTRPLPDGSWAVATGGATAVVEVADPLTHLARQSAGGGAGRRAKRVTAYMPGRVVAVLAAEGDTVQAGQGVVVLEAMKMQNEILAEGDGVLSKVYVSPGQAVEGGDPLFELE